MKTMIFEKRGAFRLPWFLQSLELSALSEATLLEDLLRFLRKSLQVLAQWKYMSIKTGKNKKPPT